MSGVSVLVQPCSPSIGEYGPVAVQVHWLLEEIRHKIFWMHSGLVDGRNNMGAR